MNIDTNPWERGPRELIGYALVHLHKNSEFDFRIAFLLLDVGVETLFKSYLTLPEKIGGPKIEWEGGKKAVGKWDFPTLCDAIEKAAGESLQGINLKHVQYFHSHRNKLYHEEDGITIRPANVQDYAELAVELLNRLLDVDLSEELRAPEIETKRVAELKAQESEEERAHQNQIQTLEALVEEVDSTVELVIEQLYPQLVGPSFKRDFPEIVEFKNANPSAEPESLSPDMQRKAETTFAKIPSRHIRLLEIAFPSKITLDRLYVQIIVELRTGRDSRWRDEIESTKEFLEEIEGGSHYGYAVTRAGLEFDVEISAGEYRDSVGEKCKELMDTMSGVRDLLQGWLSQLSSMDKTEKSRLKGDNDTQTDFRPHWQDVWKSFMKPIDLDMF